MSKLIVSIASLGTGGAERVLSVLSKPLADSFNEVLYVMWEGGKVFYPVDSRVKIISLPEVSGRKGRYLQMSTFRQLVKHENPNLVLSFLTPFNILVLLSTLGMKYKIIVAERTDPKRPLAGGKIGLLLRDLLYRRACGIITQTDYAKAYYDKIFKGKTTVIYNPVSMATKQVGMALRTEKEHVFVTAGRLEPVKGQMMMINAFARFHTSHPPYRLVIYGEGPLHGILQKRIDGMGLQGVITLAGRTNDLWNMISSAEAFLLTSEYEGMSNALIEAMCLGLPVISTNVAGATDLVKDGMNGFLIEVNDSIALAKHMTILADDTILREKMGEEAKKVYDLLREERISKQWVEYLLSQV